MTVTISYETEENTPLVRVFEDVAKYEGVVDITTDAADRPVSFKVFSVDQDAVTVQSWDESLDDGVGPTFQIGLIDITRVHVY